MQGFFVLADAINRAGSSDPDKIQAALQATDLKADQLAWWLDVMKQQNLLQGQIDPAKIIWP